MASGGTLFSPGPGKVRITDEKGVVNTLLKAVRYDEIVAFRNVYQEVLVKVIVKTKHP